MTKKEAIKLAIEAGYNTDFNTTEPDIFLDPNWWIALGKAREWGKTFFPVDIWKNFTASQKELAIYQEASRQSRRWFDTHVWHPDLETKFWQSLP